MAINPNIALGIQPVQQQPNMLAQYAQIMGIKAAQQELESNEGLRGELSQGMPDDPSKLLRYGPKGRAVYESVLKGRKEKLESDDKRNVMLGGLAGPVMDDPTPQRFNFALDRAVNFGLMTPKQREEVIAQYGGSPESIKGYVSQIYKGAITAQAQQADATSRANAATSAAPRHRQAAVAEQRLGMDKAEAAEIARILGNPTTAPAAAVTPPMGGGGGGPVTSAGPAPMATGSVASPVTQPNVLATQVAPPPAPSVNALDPNAQKPNTIDQISALIRTGKPKAIQAADALIKEYNIRNPEGEIKQDASGALVTVNRRTNVATPVLDKNGKPVMGDSKYESAYTGAVGKEQADRNSKVVTAAQAAAANIQKIDSAIELLKTGDATTGLGAELRTNIDRARALFAGDIKAGKKVADTQILDALLGSDVFSMIQSLGIGARGLDTPAERDYLRQVMTGTIQMDNNALVRLSEIRRNIEVRAIEKYNTQLEKGELNKYFQTQGIKPEKIELPKMAGSGNTVSVGGNTYTFPNAEAAAKFKKDAGIK